MTVRTTLNKHITSQDLGYLEVEGGSRGLNRRFATPFLKLCFAKVVSAAAALGYACAASILALS